MNTHTIEAVLSDVEQKGKKYLEFIRAPDLSVGVYRLAAGETDEQKPHGEDEVYYVIRGRGKFKCENEVREVAPGTVLFVERKVEHRFLDIEAELVLLVMFAPAESTLED